MVNHAVFWQQEPESKSVSSHLIIYCRPHYIMVVLNQGEACNYDAKEFYSTPQPLARFNVALLK